MAATVILSVTIICYLILGKYISPNQSQIFPLFTQTINLSFLLLGLSGVFVAYQGYRFKDGKDVKVIFKSSDFKIPLKPLLK